MLEYLMQNATLTVIIIILLILNWLSFFANEDKKTRIDSLNNYINRLELHLQQAQDTNQDLRTEKHLLQGSLGERTLENKTLRELLQHGYGTPIFPKRETIAEKNTIKINEVIKYKENIYQLERAEYIEIPETKIEKLHYFLRDVNGDIIIRTHEQLKHEGFVYVYGNV